MPSKTCTAPILVNSLPKGGTHLVSRALQMLLDRPEGGAAMDRLAVGHYESLSGCGRKVLIGIAMPQPISLGALEMGLREVRPGHYVNAHLPYQPEVADLVDRLGMKCVVILRDPRDVVVSQSFYAIRRTDHPLNARYREMTADERLMTSIIGLPSVPPGGGPMISIGPRMRSILPWREHPRTYTTWFEKLIGRQGGGSADAQKQEMQNLARHLDLEISEQEIEHMAAQLFGNTATFRKGEVGDWRNHFSEAHKKAFKEIAGDVLIDLGYERDFDW
jgi:sulfotransferase 6B1